MYSLKYLIVLVSVLCLTEQIFGDEVKARKNHPRNLQLNSDTDQIEVFSENDGENVKYYLDPNTLAQLLQKKTQLAQIFASSTVAPPFTLTGTATGTATGTFTATGTGTGTGIIGGGGGGAGIGNIQFGNGGLGGGFGNGGFGGGLGNGGFGNGIAFGDGIGTRIVRVNPYSGFAYQRRRRNPNRRNRRRRRRPAYIRRRRYRGRGRSNHNDYIDYDY